MVQARLRDALDRYPNGTVRVISMCAGQGRDLLGVLCEHPRRADVVARLVELDERNVDVARNAAADLHLIGVDVVQADAGTTAAYVGAVPADIVLACGVFGNISDDDIARTVAALPTLCAPGATVIWTRHRRPPDLTPSIRAWFEEAGFTEVAFDGPTDTVFGVGVHRLVADPRPPAHHRRLFTFVGYDSLGSPAPPSS
jgi:hypothetical protein